MYDYNMKNKTIELKYVKEYEMGKPKTHSK